MSFNKQEKPMNPEVKQLWVDALRSGEYKQGTDALATTDRGVTKYCCLGVLCELAIKDGVPITVAPRELSNQTLYGGVWSSLPDEVRVWSGIAQSEGRHEVPDEEEIVTLAELNDSWHFDFYDLADVIEERF